MLLFLLTITFPHYGMKCVYYILQSSKMILFLFLVSSYKTQKEHKIHSHRVYVFQYHVVIHFLESGQNYKKKVKQRRKTQKKVIKKTFCGQETMSTHNNKATRQKLFLRVRVLIFTPTCTSKFSYVY